jgi:SAM-dependent methyltransferase
VLSVANLGSGFDPVLFEALAEREPRSFWFRARNRLIISTMGRYFPEARSVLEVGCGTGFVLAALRDAFPRVRLVGTELFDEGLEVARRRLPPDVELLRLDITDEIPFDEEFDVVGAFDVLEHVEDDGAALAGIWTSVHRGGGTIILVPQHPWLWSASDTFAHHVRRYRRRDLVHRARAAGFDVLVATSFVSTLLPAMVASRVAHRLLGRSYNPIHELEPRVLNGIFEHMLDVERRMIERGISLPVGGSLMVVGRKP